MTTPDAPQAIKIERSLAADDSCQMQLFARGHFNEAAFREACQNWMRDWDGRSAKCDQPVIQTYWRTIPAPRDNIVCDYLYRETKKGPGAFRVTILDHWHPLDKDQEPE